MQKGKNTDTFATMVRQCCYFIKRMTSRNEVGIIKSIKANRANVIGKEPNMNQEYELIRHIESTSIKLFFVSIIHRLYHWHNDIEILLIVEGSVILETATQRYLLQKNDVFIVNTNEIHSLTRTDEPNTCLLYTSDAADE